MIECITEINPNTQNSVTQNKLAYSVLEVSELTTLSTAFIRNEIRAGNLVARKFGARRLILSDDLRAYLLRQTNQNEVTN